MVIEILSMANGHWREREKRGKWGIGPESMLTGVINYNKGGVLFKYSLLCIVISLISLSLSLHLQVPHNAIIEYSLYNCHCDISHGIFFLAWHEHGNTRTLDTISIIDNIYIYIE